jgi:hypothetical protein
MRNIIQIERAVILLVSIILTIPLWAAVNDYKNDAAVLSQQLVDAANDLKQETGRPDIDSVEIDYLLDEIKGLIRDYENVLVFAESPYPGEILLGKTPRGDDNWIETLCSSRYDGLLKEIRIRRTGSSARYLRINDIEITSMTPNGPEKQILNKGARTQLYQSDIFRLALPKPMRITRIRISIEHETNGLIISGIPYNFERTRPRMQRSRQSGPVLLGTTPPGDDTWVETICNGTARPIREIQLKRTGQRANYIRINDIEITCQTPTGIRKQVFNKAGRIRLYSTGTYSLILPQPMRVTHIRILIEHESTGLQVFGIY